MFPTRLPISSSIQGVWDKLVYNLQRHQNLRDIEKQPCNASHDILQDSTQLYYVNAHMENTRSTVVKRERSEEKSWNNDRIVKR